MISYRRVCVVFLALFCASAFDVLDDSESAACELWHVRVRI
jgi:hypothetical protein